MDDPNQCPCTTGNESFDGKTLAELGAQFREPTEDEMCELDDRASQHAGRMFIPNDQVWQQARPFQEDGHLEVDDYYHKHLGA